jgi:hypothetical protein
MHGLLQVKKKDARVHSALDNHTRRPPPQPHTRGSNDDCPENNNHPRREQSSSQDPTVCRRLTRVLSSTYSKKQPHPTTPEEAGTWSSAGKVVPRAPATSWRPVTRTNPRRSEVKLLRKEVIQPHLPVRLPCYDFVPIASPTFDRSPPCGLGHGLRVLPTFVT